MDRIRRASLSAKKEGTVKIHHGRTKSIDDAVPVTKEEIQNKAGILIEIERTKTGRKITDLRIEFIEKSAVNKEDAA